MAQYPIKMLKDEQGNPFVPLVSPEAVRDVLDRDWESMIKDKMDQLDPMPIPSEDLLNKIVQYKGTTTGNYTQGYFYKCVSNGATVPVYSWKLVNVQDLSNYLAKDNLSIYNPTSDYNPATKKYVDDIVSNIDTLKREIVQTLPVTDIKEDTIYMVPKTPAGTNNSYDEYMYINNAWEKIGDTEVDLSNYLSKTNTTSYIPSGNYNPATKKYVDDTTKAIKLGHLSKYNTNNTALDINSLADNTVYILFNDILESPSNNAKLYFKVDTQYGLLSTNVSIGENSTTIPCIYIHKHVNSWDTGGTHGIRTDYLKVCTDSYINGQNMRRHYWNIFEADSGILQTESSYSTINTIDTSHSQTITGLKTFNTLPESSVVPTTSNQLVNKAYVDNKVSPVVYDGTGVFGWYSSAQSGENLTHNYDVSVTDMNNLQPGSVWEWPSRVYTSGYNAGIVNYLTYYTGWDSSYTTQYNVKMVNMNGNYYEYAYDDTTVYKEVYPSGGVACLASDTKVWTKEGSKQIKDIVLGDKVLAYNWCLDKPDYYTVDHINSHKEELIYRITLKNKNELLLTGDHPVWEKEKGRIPACALSTGQILLNDKGEEFVVKEVKEELVDDTVYDLHMGNEILNYYVGDDKIMVFNEPVDAGK